LEISNRHESDVKEIMKLLSMSDDSLHETQLKIKDWQKVKRGHF